MPGPVPVAVAPPGRAVTVYDVIGLPPSPGGVKLIEAPPGVLVAMTDVTTPGLEGVLTLAEGTEQ